MITLNYKFDDRSFCGIETLYYLNPPSPERSALERTLWLRARLDGFSYYNSETKKQSAHYAALKASVKNNNHIWKYKKDKI